MSKKKKKKASLCALNYHTSSSELNYRVENALSESSCKVKFIEVPEDVWFMETVFLPFYWLSTQMCPPAYFSFVRALSTCIETNHW